MLDYLPNGRPDAPPHRREPTAYGVGENQFTLLELIPKPDANLQIGERVYIGKDVDKRAKIAKVRGRVDYPQLSATAHAELPYVLLEMVKAGEERFIKFYNESDNISIRYHRLDLLPGLGRKTRDALLEERKKGVFTNFTDLKTRVHQVHTPDKLIAHRIELELSDPHQKYHLFARPPMLQEGEGAMG